MSSSYKSSRLGNWGCELVVVTLVCVKVGVGKVDGKVFCLILVEGVAVKL